MSISAKYWKHLAGVAFLFFLIWMVLQGYSFPGTGFGDFTKPDDKFVRGKTLWDWMELLIIPIFLGVGAFLLNRSERNNEREIETDRQREAALQSYIDRMADLLLKETLRTTENKEVRNVARTRSLTILNGLDGARKGTVLRFLAEADLINIIDLSGANLRGVEVINIYLKGANLHNADLRDSSLKHVDLSEANLYAANLNNADLSGAKLSECRIDFANLSDTNLNNADLSGADLTYTNLNNAKLCNANLSGTNLYKAQFIRANLCNAKLSRAKLHSANLSSADMRYTHMRNAELYGSKFTHADLRNAILFDVKLDGEELKDAKLKGAKIISIDDGK